MYCLWFVWYFNVLELFLATVVIKVAWGFYYVLKILDKLFWYLLLSLFYINRLKLLFKYEKLTIFSFALLRAVQYKECYQCWDDFCLRQENMLV